MLSSIRVETQERMDFFADSRTTCYHSGWIGSKNENLFMMNSECKAGRSVVSDISDRIVTEAPLARSQTGGSSAGSNQLQDKEQDCTPDFESSEASACHTNSWTSILTAPNHDKSVTLTRIWTQQNRCTSSAEKTGMEFPRVVRRLIAVVQHFSFPIA